MCHHGLHAGRLGSLDPSLAGHHQGAGSEVGAWTSEMSLDLSRFPPSALRPGDRGGSGDQNSPHGQTLVSFLQSPSFLTNQRPWQPPPP